MRNYKEIAKKNEFIAHAAEIKAICDEKHVDIGVGVEMYRADQGMKRTSEVVKQIDEFCKCCNEDTLNAIVKAL